MKQTKRKDAQGVGMSIADILNSTEEGKKQADSIYSYIRFNRKNEKKKTRWTDTAKEGKESVHRLFPKSARSDS